MRWIKTAFSTQHSALSRFRIWLAMRPAARIALSATVLALLLAAPAQEEKKLTIYAPRGTVSVPVVERGGKDYVSLANALGVLGDSTAKTEGKKWTLRFAPPGGKSKESQFEAGKTKAKVQGKSVELAAPFVLEGEQALVPLASLPAVLTHLTQQQIDAREGSRRLFVGGVGMPFSADLQKGTPAKLVFHFPGAVSPSIATGPGRLRMTFTRDPVMAQAATQNFDDKLITSASYSEANGAAEIVVTGTAPLSASFADAGKTIIISAAPAAQAIAAPPAPPPQAMPGEQQPAAPAIRAVAPGAAHYQVVIDPGHGGEDPGARLNDRLAEKDVTLAWARRLKAGLEKRGLSVLLLRDGDVTLAPEQRAAIANGARPALFISLHASGTGTGVHVFTAQLANPTPTPGALLPWDTAQSAFLDNSREMAGLLVTELGKHQMRAGAAPVLALPLNNVATTAVSIEIAPQQGDVASLTDAGYQQAVCGAMADAIAAGRDKLGALRLREKAGALR